MPFCAASAVRALESVATMMPIFPAMAESTVPAMYESAMATFFSGSPCQMGEGSNTRMTTAATAANLASTLYSRRIKVLAPCRMSTATSWIVAFVVFCRLTHK